MVIGDDGVDAHPGRAPYLVGGAAAAVDSHNQRGPALSQVVDTLPVDPVPLFDAVGKIGNDGESQLLESDGEEGSAGDAVGVEVAEYSHAFARAGCGVNPVDAALHVG